MLKNREPQKKPHHRKKRIPKIVSTEEERSIPWWKRRTWKLPKKRKKLSSVAKAWSQKKRGKEKEEIKASERVKKALEVSPEGKKAHRLPRYRCLRKKASAGIPASASQLIRFHHQPDRGIP